MPLRTKAAATACVVMQERTLTNSGNLARLVANACTSSAICLSCFGQHEPRTPRLCDRERSA